MTPYGLTGAIQMYEAVKDNKYRETVIRYLENLTAVDGTRKENLPETELPAYFFAWKETGDEKYRLAIQAIADRADRSLVFMPFYTAYDTEFQKKGHYDEIVGIFRQIEEFDGKALIAMIDTVDWMSEEIYEYYRELRDLCQTVIRDKVKTLETSPEALPVIYGVLRGCVTGILQTEKYASYGLKAWERVSGLNQDDNMFQGMKDMIRAQIILLGKRG